MTAAAGAAPWAELYGTWGKTGSDGNATSLSTSAGGFIAGADMPVAENLRLGLAAGYGRASFDAKGRASSADVNSYTLAAYGSGGAGRFGLGFGAAYSWHDIDTHRTIAFSSFSGTADASYSAQTVQLFGEVDHAFSYGKAVLAPFAALAYVNVRTKGFSESGAAGLAAESGHTDNAFATLGLRASNDFKFSGMKAEVRGMIGARHALDDGPPLSTHAFAGADAFTVAGAPVARNTMLFEGGLDLGISRDVTLSLAYGGEAGSGAHRHGLSARLGVRF